MSLDPSLRTSGSLSQHRNVLKRGERITRLKETAHFDESKRAVIGLPKTANRKAKVGK